MKKLLLLLLIFPMVSFGQNLIEDKIEPFKELLSEPPIPNPQIYGPSTKSFFKGYWIDTSGILKLAETTFGIPIFNSGPHTKEYFNNMCFCENFGHYNPLFLDQATEIVQRLSPVQKALIQPLYDKYFKIPVRTLMVNQIFDSFENESNLLERIRNREDHNSVIKEIKSSMDISTETFFWIRRHYDGTSDKFLQLFEVIMEEFDQAFDGVNLTFLEKYNNTIWTDGISTIRFRKLSSIKHTESTKQIKGYVFDSFLKKSAGNGKLYNDKGYFVIQDKIENLKYIYDINAKSGLNVRESPSISGKIVDKLEYGISVKILKKTGESFEAEGIKGEWVEIETYNPYGHRQHLFPDNDGRNFFVNEVSESNTYLDCEMCGYKKITQNIWDILSVLDNVSNDFGDIEDSKNSFLINNNELIHTLEQGNPAGKVLVKSRFIPLSSDSIYIEEVKKENKIKYELFYDKWQRIINEYDPEGF